MGKAVPPFEHSVPLYSTSNLRAFLLDSNQLGCPSSDTTATTLSYMIYELAKHPEQVSLIRNELAAHFTQTSTSPKNQDLQNLPRLNSIIHETLRLHPAVPTALPRLTPPEGLSIGNTFIPGDTVVWCPQYAIGRSMHL